MQPTINTLFNVTSKQATVTDTYNYSTLTYIAAYGNVTARLGNTIFHQTLGYDVNSDIVIGTNDSVTFDLPVSNDKVKSGSYTITYDVLIKYFTSDVSTPSTANIDYITVTPDNPTMLSDIDDLLTAGNVLQIQFIDVDGNVLGTSTITETDGVNVIFCEFINIPTYESIVGMNVIETGQVTKEYTFDNCKVVTPSLTANINCAAAQITLQDTTVYPSYVATFTREMTLRYPRLADGSEVEAAVTTSNPSLTVGPYIWSGGYLFSLESTMSWTQADLLSVQQVATMDLNKDVQCDAALCKVSACLYSLWSKYVAAVKIGGVNTNDLFHQNFIAMGYVMNYQLQLGCGNTDAAALILTNLTTFLAQDGSTECNCGCGDSTNPTVPTKIYPLYSSIALINGVENARNYQ